MKVAPDTLIGPDLQCGAMVKDVTPMVGIGGDGVGGESVSLRASGPVAVAWIYSSGQFGITQIIVTE